MKLQTRILTDIIPMKHSPSPDTSTNRQKHHESVVICIHVGCPNIKKMQTLYTVLLPQAIPTHWTNNWWRRFFSHKSLPIGSMYGYVWLIYLHLANMYGKCRQIYHTWILWDMLHQTECEICLDVSALNDMHFVHGLKSSTSWSAGKCLAYLSGQFIYQILNLIVSRPFFGYPGFLKTFWPTGTGVTNSAGNVLINCPDLWLISTFPGLWTSEELIGPSFLEGWTNLYYAKVRSGSST